MRSLGSDSRSPQPGDRCQAPRYVRTHAHTETHIRTQYLGIGDHRSGIQDQIDRIQNTKCRCQRNGFAMADCVRIEAGNELGHQLAEVLETAIVESLGNLQTQTQCIARAIGRLCDVCAHLAQHSDEVINASDALA